ncbi:hypothetical protein BCR41DRAFT_373320 [Lobosporangium transversale]|uniref:Uncharacterized protein n=1 Tax=Lobosporangium transversale TaxID=64571 RepID=A0A1Y2GFT5_9FUNG|nr:hypothetical protein BCR41DRAFT_373320 [Lobosporangium transversale]ORZ08286.1 hypothetical protein BCR41DRAFT_373320 [Lobosporangium transversale]|eukprot:XP_021878369.1 hypothetical protein BCR41DRAFT_373320 [Lobosporangium transversale]
MNFRHALSTLGCQKTSDVWSEDMRFTLGMFSAKELVLRIKAPKRKNQIGIRKKLIDLMFSTMHWRVLRFFSVFFSCSERPSSVHVHVVGGTSTSKAWVLPLQTFFSRGMCSWNMTSTEPSDRTARIFVGSIWACESKGIIQAPKTHTPIVTLSNNSLSCSRNSSKAHPSLKPYTMPYSCSSSSTCWPNIPSLTSTGRAWAVRGTARRDRRARMMRRTPDVKLSDREMIFEWLE